MTTNNHDQTENKTGGIRVVAIRWFFFIINGLQPFVSVVSRKSSTNEIANFQNPAKSYRLIRWPIRSIRNLVSNWQKRAKIVSHHRIAPDLREGRLRCDSGR